MDVTIRFLGGPLDGQTAKTDWLSEVKVFFPGLEQVLLYVREGGELDYVYDPLKSRALTARHDEAYKAFMMEMLVRPLLRAKARTPSPAPLFSDTPVPDRLYLAPNEPEDAVIDLDPPTGSATGPDGFLPSRSEFAPPTEWYPREGDPDEEEPEERPDADYQ